MLYASSDAKGTVWLSDRRPWEQLAREIYRHFRSHPLVCLSASMVPRVHRLGVHESRVWSLCGCYIRASCKLDGHGCE